MMQKVVLHFDLRQTLEGLIKCVCSSELYFMYFKIKYKSTEV